MKFWIPALVICLLSAAPDAIADVDSDGIPDEQDNCPSDFNPGQEDFELRFGQPTPDGVGFACDNCPGEGALPGAFGNPSNQNAAQIDTDADGVGDTCDPDIDEDGIGNVADNCPYTANAPQSSQEIGAACDRGPLPITAFNLAHDQAHPFSIDLDTVPVRGEIRLQFFPAAAALEVEADVVCSGSDFNFWFFPSSFSLPVIFKVDADDNVVSPIHWIPFERLDSIPLQPAAGQWVLPLFLYFGELGFEPGPFDPPPDFNLACHIQLHRAATSQATGSYGVRLEARAKPSRTRNRLYCPAGQNPDCEPTPDIRAGQDAEYGYFTPGADEFTLLDPGDAALGACEFEDPSCSNCNLMLHSAVPGARGWNCCTWVYTDPETSVPSEVGYSNIWVGDVPPDVDPLPDDDFDGVLNRCDNCPGFEPNQDQSDLDFDLTGDPCDNCSEIGNADQLDSDGVPAGDACQCSDITEDQQVTILDLALLQRFAFGAGNPAAFDFTRCRVDRGRFPCTPFGARAVREALAGLGPALVESCP